MLKGKERAVLVINMPLGPLSEGRDNGLTNYRLPSTNKESWLMGGS